MAKTLAQLTKGRSIWPTLKRELESGPGSVQILPENEEMGAKGILAMQVSTQSDLGAVLFHTGGLLIDSGWVRVLGSGGSSLRGFFEWNQGKSIQADRVIAGSVLVADDVLGGLFALNGGALGKDMGKIYYLAPENTRWEALNLGYSDLIGFLISGRLDEFYEGYRFDGWQEMIEELTPNQIWQFGDDPDTAIAQREAVSIDYWLNDILASKESE